MYMPNLMEAKSGALVKQKLQEKERYFAQLQQSLPARRQLVAEATERAARLRQEFAAQPPPKNLALVQAIFDADEQAKHELREIARIESRQEETDFYLDLAMLQREQSAPPRTPMVGEHGWSRPVLSCREDEGSGADDYEGELYEDEDVEMHNAMLDSNFDPAQEEPSAPKAVRVENFIDREETRHSFAAQQIIELVDGGQMPLEVMHVSESQHCTQCSGDLILVKNQYQCIRCAVPHSLSGQQIEEGAPHPAQPRSMADRERTTYVQQYTYKKINHFKDWLSQFQAKENTVIPEEVLDKVRIALQQKHTRSLEKITPKEIHKILKEIGLPKYYEHKNLICNRISGNPPPFLSREQEQRLRDMFEALQEPFAKCKPKGRKNFLSYSYVLHQLLRLTGHPPRIYTQFRVLSCRQRVAVHDTTWAKMMAMLDEQRALGLRWPFYPCA